MNWIPVRRGQFYCSSACGGKCTWQAYQKAIKDAKACVKLMKSEGWNTIIWENLGWHWKIQKGAMSIYKEGKTYSSLMDDRIPGLGGALLWTLNSTRSLECTDPNRLVELQKRQCALVMCRLTAVMKGTFGGEP